MELTGLDLGAWLTESGAVVLLYEYDEVTHVLIGHVVHPMREVRYGKDGRLVSCCFLPGESQTVEHEKKLHEGLQLVRKLHQQDEAVLVLSHEEWARSYQVEQAPTPQPDDWVEITDTSHKLRPGVDWVKQAGHGWWQITPEGSAANQVIWVFRHAHFDTAFKFRCLRKDHPNFAPARQQDSAGAGIYDEQPPLVNTYADKTIGTSLFDDPTARIEVIPPPLREWRVLTPGGCWETVEADVVTTCNTSVDMYRNGKQVGFFVNPQAVIAVREVDPKPVAPTVTLDMLTPLGDTLDRLWHVVMVREGGLIPYSDVIASAKACMEGFKNLVRSVG